MFLKSIFVFSLSLAIGTTVPDDDDTSFPSEIHVQRALKKEPEDVSFVDEVCNHPGMTLAQPDLLTLSNEVEGTNFLDEVFAQPGTALMEPQGEDGASFSLSTSTVVDADQTVSEPSELPQQPSLGNLVIREPTPEDLDLLVYLEAVCFSSDLPAWYIPYIEEKPELIRVAQIGDSLVGMVLMMPHQSETDLLYIGKLSVLPQHRKQGIASALLDWVAEYGRELGYAVLALHVHTGNPNAQRLYWKHGFVVTDFIPQFYDNLEPQSAFTMIKNL
jgi:ribosomal-protein-alanine N-acetyltransferase